MPLQTIKRPEFLLLRLKFWVFDSYIMKMVIRINSRRFQIPTHCRKYRQKLTQGIFRKICVEIRATDAYSCHIHHPNNQMIG